MVQQITDIKLLVRDLLRSEWSNTGLPVALVDSDIHTGWYDDGRGFPQVTVTTDEESPLNGGQTGVTGLKGDGTGYVQHRNGTVLVDVWAGSRKDYENSGDEQVQVQGMADAVEDIIFDNLQNLTDVRSVTVTSRTKIVSTDENPTEHRIQLELTYNWTKN